MSQAGYYHHPTIHSDTIVFVTEDDLWTVSAGGGVARRLTNGRGRSSLPALSPDGDRLAYTGREEGHSEVYCMPSRGGPTERLTFHGADSRVVTWEPDGERIAFATTAGEPSLRIHHLEAVARTGGLPERLPTGPAMSISYGPSGERAIGRHTVDLARWKRYRGGLTGDIWVDTQGDGEWRRLIDLEGNVAVPLWIGNRVYFVSDHEGVGNLYSCAPDGADLVRHTEHQDYYARHPATDGERIVYHAGADLYVFDPDEGQARRIDIELLSPRTDRQRRFADAPTYLQGFEVHPEGHSILVTTRGKLYSFANWEGAVRQHGRAAGTRYRLAKWLPDGERIVATSDQSGEEALEIHRVDGEGEARRLEGLDMGRPAEMQASPVEDLVAIANHRNELIIVDLETAQSRLVDHSKHQRISGVAWSPDGRWLAYAYADTRQTSIIRLCEVDSGDTWDVTKAVLRDVRPAFDPDGKYLYFLSYRDFDPVYDNLHFELSFPWGMRPFLVTLQADEPSPFIPVPRAPGTTPDSENDDSDDGPEPESSLSEGEMPGSTVEQDGPQPETGDERGADSGAVSSRETDEANGARPIRVDREGIQERVVAFPLPISRYGRILGMKDKVVFSRYPTEGSLGSSWYPGAAPAAKGRVKAYDLIELKTDELVARVTDFDLSGDGKTLVYRSGNRLRALKAGEKPADKTAKPGRKSGWLDLQRIKVSIDPEAEWRQMYREAWRLQRDRFWDQDMSGVDWEEVFDRYLPLLDRVGTRSELSDLLWEMQGELGTSHAYEFGGDYLPEPRYLQGYLGADYEYDAESDSYRIARLVKGDVWAKKTGSPLARPGSRVREGDRVVAVGGRPVSRDITPGELLVNTAGQEVHVTVADGRTGETRTLTVETLKSEFEARYRDWVNGNRRYVHEATNGSIGYLHIPDMGPLGFAEFHRGFLTEVDRDGLVVDVRYNGGGHVSQLILEKLARRRLGYDVQRWGEPLPYPYEALIGPLVAIANEAAGSDGDMFAYAFKLLGLGPLVGKRTWGGVVGISPQDRLVDGGITTQPEYSFWFEGVGYGLENHGAEPDIEVDFAPQDYVAGRDPQLDKAIEVLLHQMEQDPPRRPEFGEKPSKRPPRVS